MSNHYIPQAPPPGVIIPPSKYCRQRDFFTSQGTSCGGWHEPPANVPVPGSLALVLIGLAVFYAIKNWRR